MVLKKITTPLDLSNMDNHNYNYEELKNDIRTTDKRLSEDMWEEIKGANTMKMLEPVQTAADLPSEAADKSLITVIDEQRVYGFVNGEWQPFNQIDLDPFEPFKTELSEIVAAYEKKIQNITQEVQSTKDSAIDSIESTQSQSESNIQQTEQSAVNSINQTQSEAESQISTIRDEMTTQASDLTALFNDSMDKLTSKQNTALAEVDSAKQAAIAEIEDFQNTDTSNWQKYKLTNDDGTFKSLDVGTDMSSLKAGNYESSGFVNDPLDDSGFYEVTVTESYNQRKVIRAVHSYSNRYFIKTFHTDGVDNGWKELTGLTKALLFEGSVSGVDSTISLSAPYDEFEYLFVSFSSTPGRQTKIFEGQISDGIVISVNNVYNDSSNAKAYEMAIAKTDLTTLTITNEASYTFTGSGSSDSTIVIKKIVGVK